MKRMKVVQIGVGGFDGRRREVIDILAVSGMKMTDISTLSYEFLGEILDMPQRNLTLETHMKLLDDEIKTSFRVPLKIRRRPQAE